MDKNNSFTEVEYTQCLSLLKYYDEKQTSLVKFATAISTGMPAIFFGLQKNGGFDQTVYLQMTALLSFIICISLLVIYIALVQNRLYFVYPARQVNAIRKAILSSRLKPAFANQMYTDVNFNAFKFLSTHTLTNALVAIQVSTFSGLGSYSFVALNAPNCSPMRTALLIAALLAIALWTLSSIYLYKVSKYHPDKSVHGAA
jgi:hypothetical protein